MKTFPSSDAEAMTRSLKGFLLNKLVSHICRLLYYFAVVPVGVENGSSVSAKERDLIGSLAPLLQGNDSKGTAARSIPIDRDVLRVDLFAAVSAGASVIV